MPRSGEHCIQPGLYASDCGDEWSVPMTTPGDEFPLCPHCHRFVRFHLIASSLPPE